jgi:hypothetical protein
MQIYHLKGTAQGYDTYSDCVVIAASEADARLMHPNGYEWPAQAMTADTSDYLDYSDWSDWAEHGPKTVTVEVIGTTLPWDNEARVVCASFHAG